MNLLANGIPIRLIVAVARKRRRARRKLEFRTIAYYIFIQLNLYFILNRRRIAVKKMLAIAKKTRLKAGEKTVMKMMMKMKMTRMKIVFLILLIS